MISAETASVCFVTSAETSPTVTKNTQFTISTAKDLKQFADYSQQLANKSKFGENSL